MSDGIIARRPGFKLTPQIISGVFLVVLQSAFFYALLHYIHVEAIYHPAVTSCLPFVAGAWLASVIPLFIFMSYPADFKNLNPLVPTHYVHILRKSWSKLASNNFKVSEKDL